MREQPRPILLIYMVDCGDTDKFLKRKVGRCLSVQGVVEILIQCCWTDGTVDLQQNCQGGKKMIPGPLSPSEILECGGLFGSRVVEGEI